jgi:hypothetical protein
MKSMTLFNALLLIPLKNAFKTRAFVIYDSKGHLYYIQSLFKLKKT